ncbi:MAG: hypothetical protein GH151_05575 [Bacteroidetes bacterium]|nr:hypothetical protein [Bacteroidota bacterium]
MRKRIFYFLLLLLLSVPLPAQNNIDLFGYFESQLMGAQIKNSFIHLHSNKLRIDLKGDVSEHVSFGANFDFITYHGKTNWNILEYLPDRVTSVVPPELADYYVFPFNDRIFLDNAYIKLTFKYADVIMGKQQISLGTGYAWNPTDVFNTKDLLDPTYEQPGHNAMRVDVPLGSRYNITALYAVGDEWENSDKMLMFKGRISHFDYSIIGVEKIWTFHDYTQFDPGQQFYLALPEKRQMIGATVAGELLGLGVWAEYAFNKMDSTKNFYELVVGGDYTFDFQTYIMFEYYRNTLGKTNFMQYNLNDWLRLLAAEQKAISRDQLYCFIQHPVTDLIYLGLSTIVSISDKSLALVPMMNYSIFENVDLLFYLNFYLGEEGTAYASNLGNGGLIRARVYF